MCTAKELRKRHFLIGWLVISYTSLFSVQCNVRFLTLGGGVETEVGCFRHLAARIPRWCPLSAMSSESVSAALQEYLL